MQKASRSRLCQTTALALCLTALPQLAAAQAIIDNGIVQLGINSAGNLIVPDGGEGLGLTYLPAIADGRPGDALGPGCDCEGWGVADMTTGDFGMAGVVFGYENILSSALTFSGTGTAANSVGDSAVSTTNILDGSMNLVVTHSFAPSASASLYAVSVEFLNQGSGSIGNLVYRRAMDWDVPPTAFSEYVTLQGWPATALIGSSDDGFVSGNPNVPLDTIADDAVLNGNFSNSGPDDHGAVFDFQFGELASGETHSFEIFYGAAASEADALLALSAVGAEVYSLGKPGTAEGLALGTPNTFIFGFAGVGGTPVTPGAANAPINQFVQMSDVILNQGRSAVTGILSDAAFSAAMQAQGLLAHEPDEGKRRYNVHLTAFGGTGSFDGTANNTAVDYDTKGLALAVDRRFNSGFAGFENALVGVQLGYTWGKAKLGDDGADGRLDSNSADMIVYGRMEGSSPYFAEAMLSYGSHRFDQTRFGLIDSYRSTPEGDTLGALLRIGRNHALTSSETQLQKLGFYGELATARTHIRAASEDNAGLATSDFSETQSHAGIGVRYDAAWKQADRTIFARVDLAALVEFGDGYSADQSTVGGATILTEADTLDDGALRLRGTLGMMQAGALTASVDYSGLVGRGSSRDHRLSAELKFEF